MALKAEAAIAAAGAAMLAMAVNEAAKLNEAVAASGILFQGTAEQVEELKAGIVEYGRGSSQSIEEITSAVETAISTGVRWQDSIEFVAQAEQLAVAGRAGLTESTELLISTLNAYGESSDQAARYSDVLFNTVNLGATSVSELAQSMSQVTPIASAAGVPIETLTAAIAALTAMGAPTSTAITEVRSAISNIITPSSQARDLAKELGIEFDAAALKSKGFEGVLREVYEATGGNVNQMGLLFGNVEGLAAALALGGDSAGLFKTALDGMGNSAGVTAAAFETMGQQAGVALQNLQNNMTLTMAAAGEPLLESFSGLAGSLSDVFSAIGQSIDDGAFDPVYEALNRAAEGLTEYLNGVAAALPEAFDELDFAGLIAAFEGLGDAAQGIFGDLDLTKPEDLREAMQAVLDTIESLTQVVTGIVQAWGPALQTVGALIDQFNAGEISTKEFVGEVLGASQVFETFKGVLAPLTGTIDLLGAGMASLAGVMATKLAAEALPATISAVGRLVPLLAATGPLGLVGALTLAGVAAAAFFGEMAAADTESTEQALQRLAGEAARVSAEMAEMDAWEPGKKSIAEVGAAADETAEALSRAAAAAAEELPGDQYDRQVAGLTMWDSALEKINANLAASGKVLLENGQIVDKHVEGLEDWRDTTLDLDTRLKLYREALEKGTVSVDDAQAATALYNEALFDSAKGGGEASAAIDKTAASAEKAAEQAAKVALELEKLASNERIKLIEANVQLNVAQIEADTQRIEAAFESINNTVTSTGETLVGMFDILGNSDLGIQDWQLLTEEIEKESKRRDDALKLQNELTQEQIKAMQLRNEAMERGDSLITIEGDGLQPHLEAFMWEVLRAIQIKVNQDGLEMLLGV
nr:phage tail tape measure protein [Thauera aromatica]